MGVIGRYEQKDRLSFVSVIREMDAGLEEGYKERVYSDIRAVSPSKIVFGNYHGSYHV